MRDRSASDGRPDATTRQPRIDCEGAGRVYSCRRVYPAETYRMTDTITAPAPKAPTSELRTTGSLDIKDSRTGKSYAVQIVEGGVEGDTAIRAMDLRPIKTAPEEFGMMTYDPAFM